MKRIIVLCILLLMPIRIKAIEISASSAILVDTDSGRILYSKNIHDKRSVASISKIMTAIIAIESEKLDDEVCIGNEVDKAYGSGIYIKKGEHIKLKDLVYGLMLRSGNDAALAIANYVGGDVSSFVSMMNDKAMKLGMKNSVFNNPSGLDEEDAGNISTAYDMSLLISYAIKNDTFKKIVGTKKYVAHTDMNHYSWINKNKLLFSYKYATGGKTGFTVKARRTLVTTASRDGLNLAVVTLNDGNDFFDHMNLFEYGFSNYTSYQILSSGIISVPDSYIRDYDMYIDNSFSYPLLPSEVDSIIIKYKIDKEGHGGYVDVYLGDKLLHSEEILFREKKKIFKKSFFSKLKEWLFDK